MTIMRDNYLSLVKKGYVLRLDENYKLVLLSPSQQKGCLDYQYQRDDVIPASATSGVDCHGNTNNNNGNTLFYCIEDSEDSEDSDEFEGDDDDDEDCDDVEEEEEDDDNTDDDADEDEEEEVKKNEQEKEARVQRVSNTEYNNDNGEDNFTNSLRPIIESWADEEWSGIAADDSGIPEWARTSGINFNNIADYELNDRTSKSSLIHRPEEDSVINLISIPESNVVYNVDELSKSVLNNTTDHEWNQPSQYHPRAFTALADRVVESSLINRPDEESVTNLLSIPESGEVYNVDELSTADITMVDIAEYFAQHGLLNVSTTNTDDAAMKTYKSTHTVWQTTTNELNGTIGYIKSPTDLPAANMSVNVPDSSYKLINANEHYNQHVIPNHVTEIFNNTQSDTLNVFYVEEDKIAELITGIEKDGKWIVEYEPSSDLPTCPMVCNDIHSDYHIRREHDAAQSCVKVDDMTIEPSGEEPWTVAHGALPDLKTIPIFEDEEIGCNEELVNASTITLPNNVHLPDQIEENINISDVKPWIYTSFGDWNEDHSMLMTTEVPDWTWLATKLNQQQIAIAADHAYSTASINMGDTAKDNDMGYEADQSPITDSNNDNGMRYEAEGSHKTNSNKVNDMRYEAEESHVINSNNANYEYYEDISSDEEIKVPVAQASTHPIFPQYGQGDYCESNEKNVYPNLFTKCAKNRNIFNWAEEALNVYRTRPSVIKELEPTGLDPNFPIHIDNETLERSLKMDDSKKRPTNLWTQCSKNRNLFKWAEEALNVYHTRPSVIKELEPTGLDPNFPIHIDNETLERSLKIDDSEERPTKKMSSRNRNVFNWAEEALYHTRPSVIKPTGLDPNFPIHVDNGTLKRRLKIDNSEARPTNNLWTQSSKNRNLFNWAEEAIYHTRPSVIKPTGLDPNFPIHIDNETLKRSLDMDDSEERPTKKMRFGCDEQHTSKDRNFFNWAQETLGQSSHCVPSHAITIPFLEDVNKPNRKRKLETDQQTGLDVLPDKKRRLTSNDISSENSNRKSIFAWADGEMLY